MPHPNNLCMSKIFKHVCVTLNKEQNNIIIYTQINRVDDHSVQCQNDAQCMLYADCKRKFNLKILCKESTNLHRKQGKVYEK